MRCGNCGAMFTGRSVLFSRRDLCFLCECRARRELFIDDPVLLGGMLYAAAHKPGVFQKEAARLLADGLAQ